MKRSVGLGAFGTFGSPNGFQQDFYHGIPFPQALDLNPNAIELYPHSELFAVRKVLHISTYSLCFCIYTYARELQSSRKGSFIGSCIVFENCLGRGTDIYECLREFHNDLITEPKNIVDGTLQVNQSKSLTVKEPIKYKELKNEVKPITTTPNAINNQESILIAGENLAEDEYDDTVSVFFIKAIEAFPHIGALYFTTSPTVIRYVKSKSLISVISWREFSNHSPSQVESTKQAKQQIQPYSKEALPAQYATQSEGYIRLWDSNWHVKEIPERIKEHNNLVIQYKRLSVAYDDLAHKGGLSYISTENKKDKNWLSNAASFIVENYTMVVLTALVLVLVLVAYFFLFSDEMSEPKPNDNTVTQIPPQGRPSISVSATLEPPPNGELDGEDLIALNKKLRLNMTASEIADLAIKFNPTDIRRRYGSQRDVFAEKLVELNKNCFDGGGKDSKFRCNELWHVPIYKEP